MKGQCITAAQTPLLHHDREIKPVHSELDAAQEADKTSSFILKLIEKHVTPQS